MSSVNTLIKWPGGKAREIKYIEHLIPEFDRYIEPFFGGGAMFFYLKPERAMINDISKALTDFYTLVKAQNPVFKRCLTAYCRLFDTLLSACDDLYRDIFGAYMQMQNHPADRDMCLSRVREIVDTLVDRLDPCALGELVLSMDAYKQQLCANVWDKMLRTIKNEAKAPFCEEDLKENLITGFTSGTYMYFRDVYNDILLGRNTETGMEYNCANFYFIREYCYGSMFRYNSKGEFNIPYGGMSYNRKDFHGKVKEIFSRETAGLFAGTDIYCMDFEEFFSRAALTERDFLFLDPPYDSDFSEYEGKAFTLKDQRRLAEVLKKTKAKFILIIKNTDYIYSLYENHFNILCFDKTYTYNVRSRNERNVEHLIITNMPV